jgi:hypothetical protein
MSMTEWPPTLAVPVSPTRDHFRGPQDAAVTNTGTINVPYCRGTPDRCSGTAAEMGDDLQFVFRNFPLTTLHPLGFTTVSIAGKSFGRFDCAAWDTYVLVDDLSRMISQIVDREKL